MEKVGHLSLPENDNIVATHTAALLRLQINQSLRDATPVSPNLARTNLVISLNRLSTKTSRVRDRNTIMYVNLRLSMHNLIRANDRNAHQTYGRPIH